jgi:hypothetical protein
MIFLEGAHFQLAPEDGLVKFHGFPGGALKIQVRIQFGLHIFLLFL